MGKMELSSIGNDLKVGKEATISRPAFVFGRLSLDVGVKLPSMFSRSAYEHSEISDMKHFLDYENGIVAFSQGENCYLRKEGRCVTCIYFCSYLSYSSSECQ